LELVQKNLESLLARAESAEQRLRNLMLQPGVEKKEQYTAAALLLGEGQEPQRVAAMLNLPLPQVQIVQELQKMATKEKKTTTRKKREDDAGHQEIATQPKVAALKEKNAAGPILLVDVIRNAANGRGSSGLNEVSA
jgi:cysteinyl-tRNA synthetase